MLVNIPEEVFADVRSEAQGIIHGAVYLQIHFRDSQVMYFKTNREKSKSLSPKNTETNGELDNTRAYSSNHSKVSKGMKK